MSQRNKNIVIFVLLIIATFLFLKTEITLFSKNFFYNIGKNKPNIAVTRQIVGTSNYSLDFKVDDLSNIDISKSYIELSASKYIFDKDPSSYSILQDRRVVFNTAYLNDPSKVTLDYSNNTVTLVDGTKIPDNYSVYSQTYLYDNAGNSTYNLQLSVFKRPVNGYWIDRLSYFAQELIWFFAIFGFFSLRKNWSIIYDSKTKKPLSGAIARIYNEGRLVQTYITNVLGFINVRVPAGKYKLVIIKPGYTFPSNLKPLNHDEGYQNLYYGEEITVKKNNSRFEINIPVDPENYQVKINPLNALATGALDTLNNSNTFVLIFTAILQIIIWPISFDSWVFGIISVILLIVRRIIFNRGYIGFGKVLDASGKPIGNAKFQVYDTQWNRPVTTFMSNEKGEFELLLSPNGYYVKVINPELKIVNANAEDKLQLVGKELNGTLYINDVIKVTARA